jgi:hypothetical protein
MRNNNFLFASGPRVFTGKTKIVDTVNLDEYSKVVCAKLAHHNINDVMFRFDEIRYATKFDKMGLLSKRLVMDGFINNF